MKSQSYLKKAREDHNKSASSTSFKAIVYGPLGSGKTSLLSTCRLPVLVHSFDPGGGKVLKEEVEAGKIIVDSQFEGEDPRKPKMFSRWEGVMNDLYNDNFFQYLGTFAIDSMTTWSQCVMNEVLRKEKRAGSHPFQQDWLPQMAMMENTLRKIMTLPCDVILIGHDDVDKDELTGAMHRSLLITGKLKKRIPLLVDEIYYMSSDIDKKGKFSATLLTATQRRIQARSRLSRRGLLNVEEEANIKALLKKVGFPTDDKPLFSEILKEKGE